MNKRVILYISVLIFIIMCIGSASIIEYYYAKKNDRIPLLSFKRENKAKQYIEYTSTFYKAYKCYSGSFWVLKMKDEEPYCQRIIRYDDDNYYTTFHNIKIIKSDYQKILNISNTYAEIEAFTSEEEIKNSILVATEYQSIIHQFVESKEIGSEKVNIEVFKSFIPVNVYGDYQWRFDIGEFKNYKCVKGNLYKDYINESCIGEWKKIELSEKWCVLAKNRTIVGIKEAFQKYCKKV